mmetsp:Transcript_5386/g.8343  ORF Transcript_5386/g.8343 Transcript_5386/m.8343 type:complete len:150 (+) Transcript_5386:61-510(+)
MSNKVVFAEGDLSLVEIGAAPDLVAETVELLKDQWPGVSEETRMKAIARSDGATSFTLLLTRKQSKIEGRASSDGATGIKKGDGKVVVAHARLHAAKSTFKNAKALILHSLCVRKELRNHGIGKRLLDAAKAYVVKHAPENKYILLKSR